MRVFSLLALLCLSCLLPARAKKVRWAYCAADSRYTYIASGKRPVQKSGNIKFCYNANAVWLAVDTIRFFRSISGYGQAIINGHIEETFRSLAGEAVPEEYNIHIIHTHPVIITITSLATGDVWELKINSLSTPDK